MLETYFYLKYFHLKYDNVFLNKQYNVYIESKKTNKHCLTIVFDLIFSKKTVLMIIKSLLQDNSLFKNKYNNIRNRLEITFS